MLEVTGQVELDRKRRGRLTDLADKIREYEELVVNSFELFEKNPNSHKVLPPAVAGQIHKDLSENYETCQEFLNNYVECLNTEIGLTLARTNSIHNYFFEIALADIEFFDRMMGEPGPGVDERFQLYYFSLASHPDEKVKKMARERLMKFTQGPVQ